MATSNPTPTLNEYKAYDFFPQSPDLSPTDQLQQQLDQSNMEVAALKLQLNAVKAQMQVSVEESVMVSEAHLEQLIEQRMEEFEEEMKLQLVKEVDVKMKVEMAFFSASVVLVSLIGGLIAMGLGY